MGKKKRADTHKEDVFGRLLIKDRLILVLEDILITGFIAWTFYDSAYALTTSDIKKEMSRRIGVSF